MNDDTAEFVVVHLNDFVRLLNCVKNPAFLSHLLDEYGEELPEEDLRRLKRPLLEAIT